MLGGPASLNQPLSGSAAKPRRVAKTFPALLAAVHVVCLIIFVFLGKPLGNIPDPHKDATKDLSTSQQYNQYVGISLMMFVGFGYLMTFLRWYGVGAVGLTMMITCLGVEVALLVEPLFSSVGWSQKIVIDMTAITNANFAVAAFLISFGGLIGKVAPAQLVVLVVLESIFYCANKQLVLTRWLAIADVGGTIIIHMFGAYFGLACSWVLGTPDNMEKEKPSTTSDLTSLLGTVVLWVYWPSFVAGALAPGFEEANTALVNTILSLLASTICTFIVSPAMSPNGLIRPVDIQNAALAGGVAIGAVANLPITPIGALLIGSLAGTLSTVGFARVQDFLLHSRLRLHDTCGIHNLHGMPSILGGVASAVVPMLLSASAAGTPGKQIAGVFATLGAALVSGAFTGIACRLFKDSWAIDGMDDSAYWEVADDFGKEI